MHLGWNCVGQVSLAFLIDLPYTVWNGKVQRVIRVPHTVNPRFSIVAAVPCSDKRGGAELGKVNYGSKEYATFRY